MLFCSPGFLFTMQQHQGYSCIFTRGVKYFRNAGDCCMLIFVFLWFWWCSKPFFCSLAKLQPVHLPTRAKQHFNIPCFWFSFQGIRYFSRRNGQFNLVKLLVGRLFTRLPPLMNPLLCPSCLFCSLLSFSQNFSFTNLN